jgi:hypothetical protein
MRREREHAREERVVETPADAHLGAPGKKTLTQAIARARLTRRHLDELLRLLPSLREELDDEPPPDAPFERASEALDEGLVLIAHRT